MIGSMRASSRRKSSTGTGNFSLSSTVTGIDLQTNNTATWSINVTNQSGSAVNLSISGIPANVIATIDTPSVTATNKTVFITISAASNATVGSYTLTLTGTNSSGTKTLTLNLRLTALNSPTIVLTATTISSSKIQLDWTYNKGTDGPTSPSYSVERLPPHPMIVGVGTYNGWTDVGLSAGETYSYRVYFTYTSGGNTVPITSNTVTVTIAVGPPDAPVLNVAQGQKVYSSQAYNGSQTLFSPTVKQGTVYLNWTIPNANGSPITGYNLYQADASISPLNWVKVRTIAGGNISGITTEVIAVNGTEGQPSDAIFKLTAVNNGGSGGAVVESAFSNTKQTKIWRYSGVKYLTGTSTWPTDGKFITQMVLVAGGGGGGYWAAAGGGGAGEVGVVTSFDGIDAASVFGSPTISYSVGIGGVGGTSGAGSNGGNTSIGKYSVLGGGGGGGGSSLGDSNNGKSGGSGGGGSRFYYGGSYATPGGSATQGSNGVWSVGIVNLTPVRYLSAGSQGFDSDTSAPPASQSGGGGGGAGETFTNTTKTKLGGNPLTITYANGTSANVSAGGGGGTWTYPDHGTSVAGTTQPYAGSGGGGGKSYTAGSAGKDGVIVIEYFY